MRKHQLFSKAYDKASTIKAGGKNTLSEEEEVELKKFLYRKEFKEADCHICGRKALNRDRTKQGIPVGLRICGPCLFNKPPEWGKESSHNS